MSHILIPGAVTMLPVSGFTGTAPYIGITLNAASETCVFAGSIILENPLGGSKTISAAGGGKIVWRTGTSTFASGSTTFDVGIQDVSTASSPTQGDGTFDVKASFTGGGGGITSAAVQTSTMTSGSKTIAHGDFIAIVFAMTARGASDSIIVNSNARNTGISANSGFPIVMDNTGGTYARTTSAAPNCYIIFDDGTTGWLFGSMFQANQPTSQTYNSGTGTADEYGNLIQYPSTFLACGIQIMIQVSGTSADAELLLYSDPLGTPTVQRTITIDATWAPATSTTLNCLLLFSSPYFIKAYTPYCISLRPTTANNVITWYKDVDTLAGGGKTAEIGTYVYAVRRLDNTGAFSEYNGGTSKTRSMTISLIGYAMEQGVNQCSGQVGVF